MPGQQKTLLDAQVPGPRRVRRENGNSIIQLKKELNAKSEIFFDIWLEAKLKDPISFKFSIYFCFVKDINNNACWQTKIRRNLFLKIISFCFSDEQGFIWQEENGGDGALGHNFYIRGGGCLFSEILYYKFEGFFRGIKCCNLPHLCFFCFEIGKRGKSIIWVFWKQDMTVLLQRDCHKKIGLILGDNPIQLFVPQCGVK